MSVHYIEVIAAARVTVAKMLTQRTGQNGFKAQITTRGGKTARANRNGFVCTLDMPSLSADTILSRSEADRMVAYLVHEVCHMLHTDFRAWGQAVNAGPRIAHWTNALEDIRIEAHEMKVGPYKAMRSLLSDLVSHLYAEAKNGLEAKGKTLGGSMLNAPYTTTILGRLANKYDIPTAKPLAGSLSPNVRTVITRALDGVKTCKTTWDCFALAKELVALEQSLKQQQPQPPKQPPQGTEGNPIGPKQPTQENDQEGDDLDEEDDTMRQGDDSQGDGDDDQEDDDQGEADDQGENDGACGEDEAEQGQADDDEGDQGGHGEAPKGDETPESGDLDDDEGESGSNPGGNGAGPKGEKEEDESEAIEPDLKLGNTPDEIAKRTGQDLEKRSGAHRLNETTSARTKARNNYGYKAEDAAAYLDGLTPANGVLHGQISRLLVSEERTTRTHHETSGRLDRRALVRMKTGAQDVFTRRDFAPGVDTAVLLLIDLSGSMDACLELARITAWALANAAESAGGKLAIAGFRGESADVTLHYVKDWQDSVRQNAHLMRSLIAQDYTPLSAAIVAGALDLEAQTATRRILIVLTDGQCDLGPDAVQSACRLAASQGVETVGIGLNCENVVKSFPPRYSVNVEDLQQLSTTGLGTLARMLEEAGAK